MYFFVWPCFNPTFSVPVSFVRHGRECSSALSIRIGLARSDFRLDDTPKVFVVYSFFFFDAFPENLGAVPSVWSMNFLVRLHASRCFTQSWHAVSKKS